jgi:hypothetical protein
MVVTKTFAKNQSFLQNQSLDSHKIWQPSLPNYSDNAQTICNHASMWNKQTQHTKGKQVILNMK